MVATVNRVKQYSNRLLWYWLLVILLIVVVLALWHANVIAVLAQGGRYGLYINAFIIGFTLLGFLNLIAQTRRLRREESAYHDFYRDRALSNSFPELPEGSMIAHRLRAINEMYRISGKVDSSALASVVVAREYARMGFPRYVQNILILLGVFGTILALSLALIGASDDLLMVNSNAVGDIISNMSVAFSTTLTSIVCYLVFSFLFSRIVDTQAMVISSLEEVTATDILPYFVPAGEKVSLDIERVLGQTQALMDQANQQLEQSTNRLAQVDDLINHLQVGNRNLGERLDTMTGLLREGFRLPVNRIDEE